MNTKEAIKKKRKKEKYKQYNSEHPIVLSLTFFSLLPLPSLFLSPSLSL